MLDLYLIRHGIAQDLRPGQGDGDRPLTPKGRQKTQGVAQKLRSLGITFDRIQTSPLVRARQTSAILLGAGLGPREEVCDHLAPGGDACQWWQQGHRDFGKIQRLALVGHQPDLSQWAAALIWGQVGEQLILKKAGMVGVRVPVQGDPWGKSQLFLLTSPKYFLDVCPGSPAEVNPC